MISPGMFIADRYEIIEKVGSGGMADVYKAKCHKLNRFVAIKVLKQEFSTDDSFVDKFRAEAQSAAGLSHPNIVNVYDVGEENGTYYIVMELIEGITLKNFIERKGRLDVREATGIAIQIAQGLEAAHANNIIHRDIKPQNIIISKDGKVKVADFGIAKAASSNTLTSSAMGSVHYISPEQARGGYSDAKSDIYSLGITIYEMLLGKVPFEGDNAVSIALLHIQEEAVPLSELLPNIPISINKIVLKCLQKKPERRYLSVSELTNDLKRSLIEPNVDFVVIPDVLNNSPTIALSSDDVNAIRNGAMQTEMNNPTELMQNNVGYNDGYNDYNNMQNYNDQGYGNNDIDNYNNGMDNYNNGDDYNNEGFDNQNYDDDYYDEEEEKVDNKLEKITIIGAVIIVVFIIALVVILFTQLSGSSKKSDNKSSAEPTNIQQEQGGSVKEVEMPDVKGDQIDEAKEKLTNEYNLNVKLNPVPVTDSKYEGRVSAQDPEAGTMVKQYDTVTLTYQTNDTSEQTNKVEESTMPDVSGLTLDAAMTKIRGKFKNDQIQFVQPKYEESSNVEADHVTRTVPSAGSKLSSTDKVTIYLSKGSNKDVTVPPLIGKSYSEAKRILSNMKLKIERQNVTDSNYDKDVVVSQVQPSGSKISQGSTITVKVNVYEKQQESPQAKEYSVNATLELSQDDIFGKFNIPGDSNTVNGSYRVTYNGRVVDSGTFNLDGDNYNGWGCTFTVEDTEKPRENDFSISYEGITGNYVKKFPESASRNTRFSVSG